MSNTKNKSQISVFLSLSMFFSALLPSLIIQLPIINRFLSHDFVLDLVLIFIASLVSGFFLFYYLLNNKTNGVILTTKAENSSEQAVNSIHDSAFILAKHSAIWLCLYYGVMEVFSMGISLCVTIFNPSLRTAFYVNIPLTNINIELLEVLTIIIAIYFHQRRILSQPIRNKFKLSFIE